MYGGNRTPAWQRDVVWTAGGVAVLAVLVVIAAIAWSRAADAETGPDIVQAVLRTTLLPGNGAEAAMLAVRSDDGIEAGAPLEVLPGAGVTIDPTELANFSTDRAYDRVAGVWSERLITGGREALLSTVDGPALTDQLGRTVDGPATDLVEAELAQEMLPSGLSDGSRMANWPLQAQRAPGEPVQPIVGIFVTVDPNELEGLSPGQIGELVIRRLAEVTVAGGADAARELLANANLEARFEQGVVQARAATHSLFEVLLAGRSGEIGARLDEARALQEGTEVEEERGLAGLLSGVDVAGLPVEAANERVLGALADVVWSDGVSRAREALADDPRAARLDAAAPLLSRLTRAAYGRAVRLAWSAGVLALLALALVAVLADGAGRVSRPGAAIVLAAAPGSALSWWLLGVVERASGAALPAGVRNEGAVGEMVGAAGYLLSSIPVDAVRDLLYVHAAAAVVGAALILVALITLAAGSVRPRRRGYL